MKLIKKIQYEKYYAWFDKDLKEKESNFKRKFDRTRKSIIDQYKNESTQKKNNNKDDQIDDNDQLSKRQKV